MGFTGHKDPSIHLRMLSHGFPFDTVQMPLNCFDASFRSFEQQVLPEAARRGVAPPGMKSIGGSGEMVRHGGATAAEALRYAMSLPSRSRLAEWIRWRCCSRISRWRADFSRSAQPRCSTCAIAAVPWPPMGASSFSKPPRNTMATSDGASTNFRWRRNCRRKSDSLPTQAEIC